MIGRYYSSFRVASGTFIPEMIQIKPEVAEALRLLKPVAALESTIVAHGMPYPQNHEVALEVEDILRSKVRHTCHCCTLKTFLLYLFL